MIVAVYEQHNPYKGKPERPAERFTVSRLLSGRQLVNDGSPSVSASTVCSALHTDTDIDQTIAAPREALAEVAGA